MDRWKTSLTLHHPFKARVVEDSPYLESSRATLGDHVLEAHVLDDGGQKTLRVHLDESLIYELGDAMPGAAWFDVCREGGYRPRIHWDRDPVTILFREVLPAMAESWTEFGLPYDENGFPDGVMSLVTLQDAHEAFRSRLPETSEISAASQAAAMFARIPLHAVVLHDRPEQRVDFLKNALDEAYVGIDLVFDGVPEAPVRLTKVSLSSTGGMRWSPWLPGGNWTNEGREFVATQGAGDFLRASGAHLDVVAGFDEAFEILIKEYAAAMDPVVERYRAVYPAAIPWHHDLANQYLHHSVVTAVQEDDRLLLTFDNGLKALAAKPRHLTVRNRVEIA